METEKRHENVSHVKLGKYANILLDDWFKRSFGTESRKRLLELFLQELIPEHRIVSLRYETTEHINPFPGKADVRIDVECTDADGSRFIVEIQKGEMEDFYDRAVFNSTFAVQQQRQKGQEEYRFPPVYFVGVMDFSPHKDTDQVMFRYRIREDSSGEIMTDDLQYIFLELPNCTKALTPEASVLDNFCYALHNMHKLPNRPDGLEQEIFTLLFDSVEISKFTAEERAKLEKDMTTENDIRNMIAFARKQGLKEGMEKGMEKGLERGLERGMQEGLEKGVEQGRKDSAIEIALNLLANGVSREIVAASTGLSLDEIAGLSQGK